LRDNEINGVKTYDFHLPKDIFYESNPANEGFCDENCLGDGVLNISKCYGGKRVKNSNKYFKSRLFIFK
jgi:hypothetical protein